MGIVFWPPYLSSFSSLSGPSQRAGNQALDQVSKLFVVFFELCVETLPAKSLLQERKKL